MYYGCREKTSQPFRNELDTMMQHKVITKIFVAYSRDTGKPKVKSNFNTQQEMKCLT
jgi:sulfite reductase alpha subunit-like flavoprotein